MPLFDDASDYDEWLKCFSEAHRRHPVRVYAYCLMPNHFHMVVCPDEDGQLAEFMRLGTLTHSMRWHHKRGSFGAGAVYQGRYRASPIQTDRYFLNACRYVEGNAVRAKLVDHAEQWPWSSLAARCRNCDGLPLSQWPILPPVDWPGLVDSQWPDIDVIRGAIARNAPIGDPPWTRHVGERISLIGGKPRGRRPIVKKSPDLFSH